MPKNIIKNIHPSHVIMLKSSCTHSVREPFQGMMFFHSTIQFNNRTHHLSAALADSLVFNRSLVIFISPVLF